MNKGNATILASAFMVLLVAAGIGAGTIAYFSDVETSSGNTFTSGTLDMVLKDDNEDWADGVTATWESPPNWAPGDEVTATLQIKNIGSTGIEHILIKPVDLVDDDGDTPESEPSGSTNDLSNHIFITQLDTTIGSLGQTWSHEPWMSTSPYSPWSAEPPLTLAEYAAGPYKLWLFSYPPDPYILGANSADQIDLTMTFKFDPDADNHYQGDTCSVSIRIWARNDQVDGTIIWQGSPQGYGYAD